MNELEELKKKFIDRELLWDAREEKLKGEFKKLEGRLRGAHSLQNEKINSLEQLILGIKVG